VGVLPPPEPVTVKSPSALHRPFVAPFFACTHQRCAPLARTAAGVTVHVPPVQIVDGCVD
jgi:hypothetical protein